MSLSPTLTSILNFHKPCAQAGKIVRWGIRLGRNSSDIMFSPLYCLSLFMSVSLSLCVVCVQWVYVCLCVCNCWCLGQESSQKTHFTTLPHECA